MIECCPDVFFLLRVYFFVFYSLSSDLVDRFPPLETLKGGKDKSAWQRVVSSPLFSCCLCRLIPRRRDSAEFKLSHHVETKVVSRNAKLFVYYFIAVDVGCTAAHHFAAGCRVAVLTMLFFMLAISPLRLVQSFLLGPSPPRRIRHHLERNSALQSVRRNLKQKCPRRTD